MIVQEPIEVKAYKASDPHSLIEVLNGASAVLAAEEIAGPGGGQVALALDDKKVIADPSILAYRNYYRVYVKNRCIGGFIGMKHQNTIIGERTNTKARNISGEGPRGWLKDVIVMPWITPLMSGAPVTRSFNFAAPHGDWYKFEDWNTDVVTNIGAPRSGPNGELGMLNRWPQNWPYGIATKWVWQQGATANQAPLGDAYFRQLFTSTGGKHTIYIGADDRMKFYIDGEEVATTASTSNGFDTAARVDVDIPAGDRILGYKVTNDGGGPAGLAVAIYKNATFFSDGNPSPASLVWQTGPGNSTLRIRAYPKTVPGWTPGEVMRTLLAEGVARGNKSTSWLIPTFSNTHDSAGVPWEEHADWTFQVGTTLDEVLTRLEDIAVETKFDPETLEFHMYNRRGEDRSVYKFNNPVTVINGFPNPEGARTVGSVGGFGVQGFTEFTKNLLHRQNLAPVQSGVTAKYFARFVRADAQPASFGFEAKAWSRGVRMYVSFWTNATTATTLRVNGMAYGKFSGPWLNLGTIDVPAGPKFHEFEIDTSSYAEVMHWLTFSWDTGAPNQVIEVGQVMKVLDPVLAPSVRRNRVSDPSPASASQYATDGGTKSYTGGYVRLTAGGSGFPMSMYPAPIASEAQGVGYKVSAGERVSAHVQVRNPNAVSRSYMFRMVYFDASGAFVAFGTPMVKSIATNASSTLWASEIAPANTATVLPAVYPGDGNAPASGFMLDARQWNLETGPTAPVGNPGYFDGSTTISGETVAWEGTANASPSKRTLLKWTKTPFFSGATPSTSTESYTWEGTPNNSFSIKTSGTVITRDVVQFEEGKNLLSAIIDGSGDVKNSLLVRTEDGWFEQQGASYAEYGRIEARVNATVNVDNARRIAEAALAQRSTPEESASYTVVPTEGHVPFKDFNVGDWVLAPDRFGTPTRRRVVSLSVGQEPDTGSATYAIEFDTIFLDNEQKLKRYIEREGAGSLGSSFAGFDSGAANSAGRPLQIENPNTTDVYPSQVLSLTGTSAAYWDAVGASTLAKVDLTWPAVSTDVDGNPFTPSFYEVEARTNLAGGNAWTVYAHTSATTASIDGLPAGQAWVFRVRAFGSPTAPGLYSPEFNLTTAVPNTPMTAPSKPVLASGSSNLIVKWDGLLSNSQPPPPRFRYVYAKVGVTGQPRVRLGSAANRDTRTIIIPNLDVAQMYDVTLVAVDGAGVESAESELASVAILGVDLGDLDKELEDAVQAAKNANQDGNLVANATLDGEGVEIPYGWLDPDNAFEVVTDSTFPGRVVKVKDGVSGTHMLYNSKVFDVIPDGNTAPKFYVSWRGKNPLTSMFAFGIVWYDVTGATVGFSDVAIPADQDDYLNLYGVTGETNPVLLDAVPVAAVKGQAVLAITSNGAGQARGGWFQVRRVTSSDLIAPGAIIGSHIQAQTIGANHIGAQVIDTGHLRAGAVHAENIGAEQIRAEHLAANIIEANHISVGAIQVDHVSPNFGNELNISANSAVTIIAGQAQTAQETANQNAENLSQMQTVYSFGPSGARISQPGSQYSLMLRNNRIEIIQTVGTSESVVSYWDSGKMVVTNFVGETVELGNHQLARYTTGTVVRALGQAPVI